MRISDRPNLAQLTQELRTMRIAVPRGLIMAPTDGGWEIQTYDATGSAIDLPDAAAEIVARHRPAEDQPEPTRDEKLAAALTEAQADVARLIIPAKQALIDQGVKPQVAEVMAQALGGVATAFAEKISGAISDTGGAP